MIIDQLIGEDNINIFVAISTLRAYNDPAMQEEILDIVQSLPQDDLIKGLGVLANNVSGLIAGTPEEGINLLHRVRMGTFAREGDLTFDEVMLLDLLESTYDETSDRFYMLLDTIDLKDAFIASLIGMNYYLLGFPGFAVTKEEILVALRDTFIDLSIANRG